MVEAFQIIGGKDLVGELTVEGSKNSTLPIMIATLVAKGRYVLKNVPNLRDIRTLVKLLESLGLQITKLEDHSYEIINTGLSNLEASYDLVKKMRASFWSWGECWHILKKQLFLYREDVLSVPDRWICT